MTNKTLIYILILITNISCNQSKEKDFMNTIYTQQDILDLYKTVQHFEEEQHYGVRIKSANCNFEILINDKKVFFVNRNKIGSVINGAYAPINYGLLKSGNQKITIRILPAVQNRQTEIKYPTLQNAQLDIEIVADDFMDGESTGEYSIFEWESPKEIKFIESEGIEMPYFTQPDLPVFEHRDSFIAEIPFDIDGWNNSVNLITNDKEELKELTEEAVTIFKELHKNFQEKNLDKIANLVYQKEKRVAQQLYFKESDCRENWDYYTEDYKSDNFTMVPLENFKLVFFGNGKMIGLELNGPKFQWDSALYSKYIEKGNKGYSKTFYRFLLHRPKPGAPLEVI
ncbi:hypothetical protein [Psychroserpens sp. NJDZ02]|uniref:hypothetical protein n=1 Tax=Psychroserpens sp. NJDZ02 TaxID=2570561 RepID=UPI0010A8C389|nr:hypothetical protein [Psychroserpens sp. NJDZ02]QCE43116.1 hypothetical protein E9099_17385 [Psychroserpens sp. NJDZ02]